MPHPIYLFSTSKHPDAISVNSLKITLSRPDIDFSKYDFLILTSKQASQVLRQYDKKLYINIPAICVSKKTAQSYEKLGGRVIACGKGYGDDLTEIIQTYPKTAKWLYLRAKLIASDFVSRAKDMGYDIDESIVYESSCSDEIKTTHPPKDAVLIFTSPSSVACFLQHHNLTKENIIIVIGQTTAKALPKGYEYFISKETNIQSCIDFAREF